MGSLIHFAGALPPTSATVGHWFCCQMGCLVRFGRPLPACHPSIHPNNNDEEEDDDDGYYVLGLTLHSLLQTRSLDRPSPCTFPLTHPAPATPASVLSEHARHTPTSGPLHWRFLCLNALAPAILRAPSSPRGLGSVGPSPAILSTTASPFVPSPHPSSPLHLYPQNSATADILAVYFIHCLSPPLKFEPPPR